MFISSATLAGAQSACTPQYATLYLTFNGSYQNSTTCGSFTVTLSGIGQPNATGVSPASFDIYYNGVLTNATQMTQDSTEQFNVSGNRLNVQLLSVFLGVYPYQRWVQVYLYPGTPTTVATTTVAPTPLTATLGSLQTSTGSASIQAYASGGTPQYTYHYTVSNSQYGPWTTIYTSPSETSDEWTYGFFTSSITNFAFVAGDTYYTRVYVTDSANDNASTGVGSFTLPPPSVPSCGDFELTTAILHSQNSSICNTGSQTTYSVTAGSGSSGYTSEYVYYVSGGSLIYAGNFTAVCEGTQGSFYASPNSQLEFVVKSGNGGGFCSGPVFGELAPSSGPTTTIPPTTTVPPYTPCSSESLTLYVGNNATCGSYTLSLLSLSQPNAQGISQANYYIRDSSTGVSEYFGQVGPVSAVINLTGGHTFYIFTNSTFAGLYAYQKYARIYISSTVPPQPTSTLNVALTPTSSSSGAPVTISMNPAVYGGTPPYQYDYSVRSVSSGYVSLFNSSWVTPSSYGYSFDNNSVSYPQILPGQTYYALVVATDGLGRQTVSSKLFTMPGQAPTSSSSTTTTIPNPYLNCDASYHQIQNLVNGTTFSCGNFEVTAVSVLANVPHPGSSGGPDVFDIYYNGVLTNTTTMPTDTWSKFNVSGQVLTLFLFTGGTVIYANAGAQLPPGTTFNTNMSVMAYTNAPQPYHQIQINTPQIPGLQPFNIYLLFEYPGSSTYTTYETFNDTGVPGGCTGVCGMGIGLPYDSSFPPGTYHAKAEVISSTGVTEYTNVVTFNMNGTIAPPTTTIPYYYNYSGTNPSISSVNGSSCAGFTFAYPYIQSYGIPSSYNTLWCIWSGGPLNVYDGSGDAGAENFKIIGNSDGKNYVNTSQFPNNGASNVWCDSYYTTVNLPAQDYTIYLKDGWGGGSCGDAFVQLQAPSNIDTTSTTTIPQTSSWLEQQFGIADVYVNAGGTSTSAIPASCISSPGFECADMKANASTNGLYFTFGQNTGTTMYDVELACLQDGTQTPTNESWIDINNGQIVILRTMVSGGTWNVTDLPCFNSNGEITLGSNSYFDGTLWIRYQNGNGGIVTTTIPSTQTLSVSTYPELQVIDAGQSAYLLSSVNGGLPPYTYQWLATGPYYSGYVPIYGADSSLYLVDTSSTQPTTNYHFELNVKDSYDQNVTGTPVSVLVLGASQSGTVLLNVTSQNVALNLTNTASFNLNLTKEGTHLFIQPTSKTQNRTTFIVTNVTSGTPPAPFGQTKLLGLNVSTLAHNFTVTFTTHYNCNVPSNKVAPYVLNDGVWTKVTNFTVNAQNCTVSFALHQDPTVGLFENSTGTGAASSTISGGTVPPVYQQNNSVTTYIEIVVGVAVVLAIIYFLFIRGGSGSVPTPSGASQKQ